MGFKRIKNGAEIATTPGRELALKIADAGLEAIDTARAVAAAVRVHGNILHIKDAEFDLGQFKRIKVVGFGKVSCAAAAALEKILGEKITGGAVIDVAVGKCEHIEHFVGTHPRPSIQNVEATKHIINLANGITAEDLVLIIVSGGGSSLLCYPESECAASAKLYDKFLPTGATIQELNLVRKHLSTLKGGGLAKLFYPATIISLVFSDVPGEHDEIVASGPTFRDESTVEYARNTLKKYNIPEDEFELIETPKDDRFFEKVTNITLVSNKLALAAMEKRAEEFGLRATEVSPEIYDRAGEAAARMFAGLNGYDVALGAGEISIVVPPGAGRGGRNTFLALRAAGQIKNGEVFVALASDGADNSDAAGAIADRNTLRKAKELGLDPEKYLKNYDSYTFFEKAGGLIKTGLTGANVSDLMILVKK